jgi:hypothetical protein
MRVPFQKRGRNLPAPQTFPVAGEIGMWKNSSSPISPGLDLAKERV